MLSSTSAGVNCHSSSVELGTLYTVGKICAQKLYLWYIKCPCTTGTCKLPFELSGKLVVSYSSPTGMLHLLLAKIGICNGPLGNRDAFLSSFLRCILNAGKITHTALGNPHRFSVDDPHSTGNPHRFSVFLSKCSTAWPSSAVLCWRGHEAWLALIGSEARNLQ